MIRAASLALSLALAAPVLAQAADPTALPAAERLLETIGVTAQLDQTFATMAPMMAKNAMAQLEAGQSTRALFEALVKGDYARKQRLEAILAEEYLAAMRAQLPRMKREYAREYAATFTAAELVELNAFFSGGAGAKFVAATAALQTRLGEVGQRIGMEVGMIATPRAIDRARDELESETSK